MPIIEKDLRNALLALPAARKDKLLLQLVSGQPLLLEQLRFELLEGAEGLELRREALRELVRASVRGFHYNAAELLTRLRALCPPLSLHAKITADAYGEVQLLLLLLQEVFVHQKDFLRTLSGANEALSLFLAKRAEEMLHKLCKLHEDLHVEFEDEVNQVLSQLHASSTGYAARKLDLPVKLN